MPPTALDLVAARIIDPIASTRPCSSVADALLEVRSRSTPSLPVIDSGRQVGSVSVSTLEALALEEGALCVRNVMDAPLPELDETASEDEVRRQLALYGAVVVTRQSFPIGLLTAEDTGDDSRESNR